MATKGASNHYGNARGGRQGNATKHIGYAWARGFNRKTLADHFRRHGEQVGTSTQSAYAAHAVKFANTVDKQNVSSFRDKKGTTYKFNRKTGEFAIITKKGIVVTYFKPREGIDYYELQKRRQK